VNRACIVINFIAALFFLCIQCILVDTAQGETITEAIDAIENNREEITTLENSDNPARYDMIAAVKDVLSSFVNKGYAVYREAFIVRYDSKRHALILKPRGWGGESLSFETDISTREALDFKHSFSGKLRFTVRFDETLTLYAERITDESGRIRFRPVVTITDFTDKLPVLSEVQADGGRYIILGPEGKRAIILGINGAVTLYSTVTGKKIWQSNIYTIPSGGSISYDGKILLVSTISGSLYVFSMRDGTKTARMKFPGLVRKSSLSPDAKLASVGLMSGDVFIVDIESKKTVFHTTHNGPVTSVTFSPDNRFAFSGGGDSRVKIIYLPVMKMIWELHLKGVPETLMISPSGDNISALISFFYLGVWKMDLWTKEIAWRFNSFVTSYDISPDGALIACSFTENKVGLYEVQSGKKIALFPQEHTVNIIRFLPDSNYIASADTAGNISVIDYEEKKRVVSHGLDTPAAGMATNSSGEYLSILCEDGKMYTYYLKSLSGVYPMFKVGSTLVLMKIPSG
jgi:WD40 repeat protein